MPNIILEPGYRVMLEVIFNSDIEQTVSVVHFTSGKILKAITNGSSDRKWESAVNQTAQVDIYELRSTIKAIVGGRTLANLVIIGGRTALIETKSKLSVLDSENFTVGFGFQFDNQEIGPYSTVKATFERMSAGLDLGEGSKRWPHMS